MTPSHAHSSDAGAAVRPARVALAHGTAPHPAPADDLAAAIPGLCDLRRETLGEPEICIAVLDGPVDLSHPALAGANLKQVESLVSSVPDGRPASRHGTHIASIIFGQHDGPVAGIAPRCRGVSVPIFESTDDESFRPCSELDLARALALAVQHGAHVINISGGQFSASGTAWPLLESAVRDCTRRGALIVAAIGNDGCECLHIPGALDSVLAVGAMDRHGRPLESSNWGGRYQAQGVLALGEAVLGAGRGGVARESGTSYATAIVSGVAGLLLSIQRQHGRAPDAAVVRQAILTSALGCTHEPIPDCSRLLAGRLNVGGALTLLTQGTHTMPEVVEVQVNGIAPPAEPFERRLPSDPAAPAPQAPAPAPADSEKPKATCACKGGGAPQFVYALGQIGYDFANEARLDSLAQKMAGHAGLTTSERALAFEPSALLAYLEKNPWDAAAVEWTLTLDGTPIYAIRPMGPFAADAYRELRAFLKDRVHEGVDRVSVPGVVAGKARLLWGQEVPVIVPEIRGMYSWTSAALVDAVVGPTPANGAAQAERDGHERKAAGVRNFLDRVYHELRNLGVAPQDRAVNFAATNAFEIGRVYESAIKDNMELDHIDAARSPIGRPGSDCWDVQVYFFYPERQVQTVRKVYRYTVDVSDTVPVTIGPMRSWFTR
jgi:hypothetical protein